MSKDLNKFSAKYLMKLTQSLLAFLILGSVITSKSCSCSKREDQIVQICFTPGGQCRQLVEEAIGGAQHTILVQAYFFTAPTIAKALVAAHQRGVNVKILIDRSQLTKKNSQISFLLKKGIPVWVDMIQGIAHNKVMILDEDYVLTGSFNWTDAAQQQNAENLILIRDRHINQIYQENWERRMAQAQPTTLQDIAKAKKQANKKKATP
jgi:phosphatidylserine/phosphatidylglycerophosphate/cardiolipin synthase-like enzyme